MAGESLRLVESDDGTAAGELRHGVRNEVDFVAVFNAAGATGRCGELHEPESHLVPNVLKAAAEETPHIRVFGTDYPTPDGTAVRDYVHVADLAEAHVLAVEYLRRGGDSDCLNLGSGDGFSVMEVIETARKMTGKPIPVKVEGRRAGDPPKLVADASRAKKVLGWKPTHSDLSTILRTQWDWRLKHPTGYPK